MPSSRFFKHVICILLAVSQLGIRVPTVDAAKAPRVSASCSSLDSTDFTTHAGAQVDNRLRGKNPANALSVYINSTKYLNPLNAPVRSDWTRNPNFWGQSGAKPLDFTGVAAWNDANGLLQYTRGVTMISPRHFVVAAHFPVAVGNTIGFIDAKGKQVTRKVVGMSSIIAPDTIIGKLDADVPNSIAYYPLMSYEVQSKLMQKKNGEAVKIPMAVFDQEGKAVVAELININQPTMVTYGYPAVSPRREFSETLIVGDSGQPSFIIADNQPILISASYGGGSGSGPFLGRMIPQINAAIKALGGTNYTVTEYTSNCFTSYDTDIIPYFIMPEATLKNLTVQENHVSDDRPIGNFVVGIVKPAPGTTITYDYSSSNFPSVKEHFTLNANGGLYYKNAVDYETMPRSIQIRVTAHASNGTAPISIDSVITVKNTNDAPKFTSERFVYTAASGAQVGTRVGGVSAYDPDTRNIEGASSVLTYSMTDTAEGFFGIDATTGNITVKKALPLRTVPVEYTIPVKVDSVDTMPPQHEIVKLDPKTLSPVYYQKWNVPNTAETTVKITVLAAPVSTPQTPTPTLPTPTPITTPIITPAPDTGGSRRKSTLPAITSTSSKSLINGTMVKSESDTVEESLYVIDTSVLLPLYTTLFKVGQTAPDIVVLQQYLNSKGYMVSASGLGSKGNETAYFGNKTALALKRFQSDVGISPATGHFGPLTKKYMEMHP